MIITTKTEERNIQIKNYWSKFHDEKRALYKKQIIKGCIIAPFIFLLPYIFAILLLSISGKSFATGLADLKFGRYQIADSQWNVSACMYTATCQIYSKNPGTAYKIPWTSGQLAWATGDYVAFVLTGDATNPYNAIQYSANGTQKDVMGTGHIINMGSNYFFFVGNDNDTGQLFSMTQGFDSTSGVTWTGTLNPTSTQVDAYASGGSTTPLAAGQTAAPAGPPPPPPFNGTVTFTNQSGATYTDTGAGVTSTQQSRVDTWQNRSLGIGNGVSLDVNGSNNSLYVEQVGDKNSVSGIGQPSAVVQGSYNSVTIRQGAGGVGQNEINLRVIGDSNSLDIGQARDNTGAVTGTNGHYQAVDISGYQNTLTTQQSNTGGVGGHYQETTINGNQNSVTVRQTDNGNKVMFTTVTGNNNTVDAVQKGAGQHQLTTNLTGNGNSALVVQEGSQQNKAIIDLTNAGGPATLDLQQSGGKNFTIQQMCGNPAGCTTTVRQ